MEIVDHVGGSKEPPSIQAPMGMTSYKEKLNIKAKEEKKDNPSKNPNMKNWV
jgi:hypothetical protein